MELNYKHQIGINIALLIANAYFFIVGTVLAFRLISLSMVCLMIYMIVWEIRKEQKRIVLRDKFYNIAVEYFEENKTND